jgi:hypothetical protein
MISLICYQELLITISQIDPSFWIPIFSKLANAYLEIRHSQLI